MLQDDLAPAQNMKIDLFEGFWNGSLCLCVCFDLTVILV